MFFRLNIFVVFIGITFIPRSAMANRKHANSDDTDSSAYYRTVKTYVNPVLAGDHPDPTLLKVGNDFYMCGSTFHFTPYLPILHSTDLIHWETISRVVPPNWPQLANGKPGGGIWQGAITYFYGSWWIYFSNTAGNGQYFCKSVSPTGPWSAPVKVKTTPTTGTIGYDNSIFVDDDGTAYMLTKAGKPINRIQKIAPDGHLTGDAINIDWINANSRYSWAEGPVMFKHDGWYYYTFARDVNGGQYLYRTKLLTADSSQWQAMGDFFAPITDAKTAFRTSNHMSAAVTLADGSLWSLAQSYEKVGGDDWSGQGRQTLLHHINFDSNGRPIGEAPTTRPIDIPNLPKSNLPWLMPRSDGFNTENLSFCWHFLNKTAAANCTLSKRKGWLSLDGEDSQTHLLQKEAGHYYALVTRVDVDANADGKGAGIYLCNGDETVNVKLFSGYHHGSKIIFAMGDDEYEANNSVGKMLWLKLERNEHNLTAYFGADGINWFKVGKTISAVSIDKAQPDFNHWVGTSIGLFAKAIKADFNLFIYKDGFSTMPATGYNNYFGVRVVEQGAGHLVTNTSVMGGWIMLGGVDLGNDQRKAQKVKIEAAANLGGELEIWADDIEGKGKLLATVPITPTGGADKIKAFTVVIPNIVGQHDVYLRFPQIKNAFYVKSVQFLTK